MLYSVKRECRMFSNNEISSECLGAKMSEQFLSV